MGRARGRYFHKTSGSDNLALEIGGHCSFAQPIKIRVAPDAFLNVVDIHDAQGSVRTTLPRVGSNIDDHDQGQKDQDDDG